MTPHITKGKPARVVRKTSANKTSYILHFEQPQIARRGKPGQFVQILTTSSLDPFLPRPMSIFSTDPKRDTFSILFTSIGKGTKRLAQLTTGVELSIVGPLGNTFTLPGKCRHVVLVAGGVGLPPLDFWARQLMAGKKSSTLEITMLVGARSAAERLRIPKTKGVRRIWSTDDGSAGFHGNVVQLLQKMQTKTPWPSESTTVYGCGPLPMLRALQNWLLENNYAGQLSLEEMMACGYGVCSGCVVASRPAREGYEKYKRVCYDGPVFDAREVIL